MGVGFQKRVSLGRGLSANLSTKGLSISFRIPGIGSLNFNPRDGKFRISASKGPFRVRRTLPVKPKEGGEAE
jgi:hypothetical protein